MNAPDAEAWRVVKPILDRALTLASSDRAGFLDSACGVATPLRVEVDRLLAAVSLASAALPAPEPLRRPTLERADGPEARVEVDRLLGQLAQRGGAFAKYRIGNELRRGGMGAILEVQDVDLGRNLAMKVILAGEGGAEPLARFLNEARITGQLEHPGIVPVHELGLAADGRVYFTMQRVQGRELSEVFEMARSGAEGWSKTRALGVLLRVCEAMAYAHDKGVVHRDLKPANVMVGRFGEVYVVDWGLARALGYADGSRSSWTATDGDDAQPALGSPAWTRDGEILGTPAYMPPEQAHGQIEQVDRRADVYALGAMLYELLTDQMPYCEPGARLSPLQVIAAVRQGPPQPPARLAPRASAELVAICAKAMARAPSERYENTSELAEDLRAFLEHRVVRAFEVGPLAELRKWVRRNRRLALTALVAAAAVLVLSVVSLVARTQARAGEREVRVLVGELVGGIIEEAERIDGAERSDRLLALVRPRIDRLVRSNPDELELLEQRGRCLQLEALRAELDDRLDVADALQASSLASYQELVAREPASVAYQRGLSKSIVRVGDIAQSRGDLDEALARYQRSLDLDLALHRLHPQDPRVADDLCWSYERMANWLPRDEQLRASYLDSRHALALELFEQDPDRELAFYNLASSHWSQAKRYRVTPDPERVGFHLGESRRLTEQLIELAPTKWRYTSLLAEILSLAALHAAATGNAERARSLRLESVRQRRKIIAVAPGESVRPLLLQYRNIAREALERSDFDGAVDACRDQLGVADFLPAHLVASESVQDRLLGGRDALMQALEGAGRTDEDNLERYRMLLERAGAVQEGR